MDSVEVQLQILPHGRGLPLPAWQTDGAAGADLHAAVQESMELTPGMRITVPTGLALALPVGWEAQVRPRSGLAFRHGVTVLNAPGTIDSDYRGEIHVMLINHGADVVRIERGARIAQLVLAPITRGRWAVVTSLPDDTERGRDGFGSTGGGLEPE